jgi:DNA-cytosine methyltransferase
MKVLSLFDGISCARVALERAGIEVEQYWASEIDKYASLISKKNYPMIRHVGDVRNLKLWDNNPTAVDFYYQEGDVDLLIGGSPCQDLSISKSKTRKGLDGVRSALFYEYVRILNEVKPKYFILENVASMSDESRDIISKELGVQPIELNAKDFSAQNRARYFWTNIPVKQPTELSSLVIEDILESEVDEKYYYNDFPVEIKDVTKNVIGTIGVAGHDILKRIYNRNSKSATVTTCAGGNTQHKIFDGLRVRKLTPVEYERLQGLPTDYTKGVSDSQRYKCCGNAFNVDVVAHILSFIPKI